MKNLSDENSDEIERLADQILINKKRYYEGNPVISDSAYDTLEEKLRMLDPQHPVLYIVGTAKSGKVSHETPMLSCQKATDIETILKWSKGLDLFIGYKIDGFSLSLLYENGRLIQAATRGNGITGDDATIAVMKIPLIPKSIPEKAHINIRGELFMKISEFNRINQLETNQYSSPRNLAVGTIKQKDLGLIDKRKLDFFAFELHGYLDDADLKTKTNILKSWNFKSADFELIKSPSLETITKVFEKINKRRSILDFEIDGLLLKYNNTKDRLNAGSTEHHPKWMIALKFESQGKVSTVKKITWQVGRLGVITPVAELEPVEVMGALIKRATLHNADFVETLDISQGDKVLVIRSGDVIPKITEIVEKGKKHTKFPSNCPSCNSILKRDGVSLRCMSTKCRDKEIQKIYHWVKSVDIVGLGPKNIAKMYDSNLISHFSDLYHSDLTEGKLTSLFGKNGSKIYYNIKNSREFPLQIFLSGLGIENLGKGIAKILVNGFGTIEKLKTASLIQLMQLEGISDTIANCIVTGLNDPSLADALLTNGVKIITGEKKKKSIPNKSISLMDYLTPNINGGPSIENQHKKKITEHLQIYVTGKVQNITKKEIKSILKDNGHEWAPLTKKLDLLITGDDPSSLKLEKARKYGIKTITWKDFEDKQFQS